MFNMILFKINICELLLEISTSKHSNSCDYLTYRAAMRECKDTSCILSYLSYVGLRFTWTNNHDENPIGEKLDIALVNESWLTAFPLSFVTFKVGGISDHSRL